MEKRKVTHAEYDELLAKFKESGTKELQDKMPYDGQTVWVINYDSFMKAMYEIVPDA